MCVDHFEMNPSDGGHHDRFVAMNFVKRAASERTLRADGCPPFRVVILSEMESTTQACQAALRRTMEKYHGNCRIILVTSSLSAVIAPLRSRCLCIRVGAPSADETVTALMRVADEHDVVLPHTLAVAIADDAGGNMRRALLSLQAVVAMNRCVSCSCSRCAYNTIRIVCAANVDLHLSHSFVEG